MTAISRGATVSITAVPHFNTLSLEDASRVIYSDLVPACEAKGIKLSYYGNHAGTGSLLSVEEYDARKAAHTLFNVEKIQQVFALLPALVQDTSGYKSTSYSLKHRVEERLPGEKYVTNGDLIAAMLLKGYQARFGKRTELMTVNCEFKVKMITP